MSVIIEGLTLPKHNPKETDKNVLIGYAIVKEDNTAELCLEGVRYLIKMLPTPHGDLVDRDDLTDEINRVTFAERYDYNVAYNIVTDADTIIEAEVSE